MTNLFRDKLEELDKNLHIMGIAVYAILKKESEIPLRLNIQDKFSNDLKNFYIENIKAIADNECQILPLSSCDDRKNAVYLYDLDETPAEFDKLKRSVSEEKKGKFNPKRNSLGDIKALLIQIGYDDFKITLYKILASVSIFSPVKGFFGIIKSYNQIERIENDFLRFDSGFQIIQIQDDTYIKDLKVLEKLGFYEILKKQAINGLKSVQNMGIIDDMETLKELIEDVTYARKFTKIHKSSPVINGKVSNEKIIDFCGSFKPLKNKIKLSERGDKIVLNTKKSRDLFIKLLMDDFLTSELTNHHYESKAKDSID